MNGVFLSDLRKMHNLTQRQLARKIGFTPSAIAMYEIGARTPSLKRARALAQYFNISMDDIRFSKETLENGI